MNTHMQTNAEKMLDFSVLLLASGCGPVAAGGWPGMVGLHKLSAYICYWHICCFCFELFCHYFSVRRTYMCNCSCCRCQLVFVVVVDIKCFLICTFSLAFATLEYASQRSTSHLPASSCNCVRVYVTLFKYSFIRHSVIIAILIVNSLHRIYLALHKKQLPSSKFGSPPPSSLAWQQKASRRFVSKYPYVRARLCVWHCRLCANLAL